VLVQFAAFGFEAIRRAAVYHYRIDGETPQRIDPLALRPLDFVQEWLTHDWPEATFWSEAQNRLPMRDTHEKLHKDSVGGQVLRPTMHCPGTPELWQVGVDFSDPPTPFGTPPRGTYFLVRWRPPYRFTMVDIRDRPFEGCTQGDRRVDDGQPPTLFPDWDWR